MERFFLITNNKRCSSVFVADSCLDHLKRFKEAVKNAGSIVGCWADMVHLVSNRDFAHALERFKKFNNFSSPMVAATTEFKIMKEKMWTETFINVENSLALEYPDAVVAHEFAHIRQIYDRCCIPKLVFKNSCPAKAREMALVFIMELEEVVADSLLPSQWRNNKNRAILRRIERYSVSPHPLFLAALRATTDFKKEDSKLFQRVFSEVESDSIPQFSFRTALQCFRYFYIKRKIEIDDLDVIEGGINKILGSLCGVDDPCHVEMEDPFHYM